jgi:chorismate synthase
MSFSYGENIKLTLFGQSHAPAVGVVIEGLPVGETFDMDEVQAFMQRRAPGKSKLTTPRSEPDLPRIVSGYENGKTCGAPLCALIENTDVRSGDYDRFKTTPRPSHADYPALVKYGDAFDIRGGGQFSARMTAPLCFAGALCLQLLKKRGVVVGAHIYSIGDVQDAPFDDVNTGEEMLLTPGKSEFPVLDDAAGKAMQQLILDVSAQGDSIGGVIECAAIGLMAGLGDPLFGSLESRIASLIFAIPAVRGIEFGAGFASAAMRGSAHNDAYYYDSGIVKTRTNHHGGIIGGLTSGMPVVFRTAFKPTPSIAVQQQTVDLETGEDTVLTIKGRHDPCVAVRAVPCVEAAAAIALWDCICAE